MSDLFIYVFMGCFFVRSIRIIKTTIPGKHRLREDGICTETVYIKKN